MIKPSDKLARAAEISAKGTLVASESHAPLTRACDTARLHLEPRYVRPADAARILGISRSKFYEALKSGQIPHVKWGSCTLVAIEHLRVPGESEAA